MKKYIPGEKIKSIDFLMKQDVAYFNGKVLNRAWFSNYQTRAIMYYMRSGRIKKAIRVIPDDGTLDNAIHERDMAISALIDNGYALIWAGSDVGFSWVKTGVNILGKEELDNG